MHVFGSLLAAESLSRITRLRTETTTQTLTAIAGFSPARKYHIEEENTPGFGSNELNSKSEINGA